MQARFGNESSADGVVGAGDAAVMLAEAGYAEPDRLPAAPHRLELRRLDDREVTIGASMQQGGSPSAPSIATSRSMSAPDAT